MIFWGARATIRHLNDEVKFWRDAWKAERQRANLALDRLLNEKQVAPITGPLLPDVIAPPTDEEREDAAEMNRAGEIPYLS